MFTIFVSKMAIIITIFIPMIFPWFSIGFKGALQKGLGGPAWPPRGRRKHAWSHLSSQQSMEKPSNWTRLNKNWKIIRKSMVHHRKTWVGIKKIMAFYGNFMAIKPGIFMALSGILWYFMAFYGI